MKTNNPAGQTPVPVAVSSTTQLFRRSKKIDRGAYYGTTSHFAVDVNTIESAMLAFYKWAMNGESDSLMSDLSLLKQNLSITNPCDQFLD